MEVLAYRIEHRWPGEVPFVPGCCDDARRPQMVPFPYADRALAPGREPGPVR